MNKKIKKKKIIIALDFSNIKKAKNFVNFLNPNKHILKIGQEMFSLGGQKFLKKIVQMNFKIFLDLKFNDIPTTVFKAIQTFKNLKNLFMISVHASGGKKMLEYAKKSVSKFHYKPPLLIAATLLSSLSFKDLNNMGVFISISDYIKKLSLMSYNAGLDGVVCPGYYAYLIKKCVNKNFKIISPGIRFSKTSKDDQKNFSLLRNIYKYPIDYIVLGRIINCLKNPKNLLKKIDTYNLSSSK